MSRSRSLLLAGALVASALVPAAAAGAAPSDNARARAEHERIVAHWTPERMRAAQPREFVRRADGSFALATPNAKPDGSGGKGKPGGDSGDGDGTTSTVVTGASWPRLGTPVNERTGKVLFTFDEPDGQASYWICSGTVIDDDDALRPGDGTSYSLVLTAAHCVYDQATSSFARNWIFIPDFDETRTYDCPSSEYGCWTADGLVAHTGFTSQTRFTTEATLHDVAVAVVGDGGKLGVDPDLEVAVGGSYPLAFDSTQEGDTVSAFGYPAAKKYDGTDLVHCSGPATTDPYNGGVTWGLACNMTGGSSGGPWFDAGLDLASGEGGSIVSLNSYGYRGLNYMFGPTFGAAASDVYNRALDVPTGFTTVG